MLCSFDAPLTLPSLIHQLKRPIASSIFKRPMRPRGPQSNCPMTTATESVQPANTHLSTQYSKHLLTPWEPIPLKDIKKFQLALFGEFGEKAASKRSQVQKKQNLDWPKPVPLE